MSEQPPPADTAARQLEPAAVIIPLDVKACSRAYALTCGCHSDSVSSTRAT